MNEFNDSLGSFWTIRHVSWCVVLRNVLHRVISPCVFLPRDILTNGNASNLSHPHPLAGDWWTHRYMDRFEATVASYWTSRRTKGDRFYLILLDPFTGRQHCLATRCRVSHKEMVIRVGVLSFTKYCFVYCERGVFYCQVIFGPMAMLQICHTPSLLWARLVIGSLHGLVASDGHERLDVALPKRRQILFDITWSIWGRQQLLTTQLSRLAKGDVALINNKVNRSLM